MIRRRHAVTEGQGRPGAAAVTVTRRDGSRDHYVTMPWHALLDRRGRRYRRWFLADLLDRNGDGRVWVECPTHPIRSRRARRLIRG